MRALHRQRLNLRDEANTDARRDAVRDTGLRPETFPAPSWSRILDPAYVPEDGP
jgi:hypothetical protein